MSSLFEAVTALWSSLRYIGQVLRRSNSAMLFGNLGRAGTDKHRSGRSIAGTCTFLTREIFGELFWSTCSKLLQFSLALLTEPQMSLYLKDEGTLSSKSQASANRKPTSFRCFNPEHNKLYPFTGRHNRSALYSAFGQDGDFSERGNG